MTKENNITAETQVEAPVTEEIRPQTVPMEAYEALYRQALDIESRYKKLFELYNNLLEAYLSQK